MPKNMSEEISNTQLYTDYFIAVYYNGEVRKLSFSSGKIPINTDVRFLIHCEFIRKGNFSEYVAYYRNKIFNNTNNRIEDNTINWEGIKCTIHEEDTWGDVKGIWIQLKADIWDKMGVMETKTFNNTSHTEHAFRELISYLNELTLASTHSAMKYIKALKEDYHKTIKELVDTINELEKDK